MGFLNKLFGRKDSAVFEMEPTSVMMDEDRYWQLIADSLANTDGEQESQASYLTRELEKLPPAEIVGFRLRTDKLLYDTYNPDMWCAGYVMNGGCSDDAFEYFRLWVISRGREVYENARANPDSLVDVSGGTLNEVYKGQTIIYHDFERLWSVANDAFQKVTGKDLYDYIDNDNFKTNEGNYPHDWEFTWQEEDPESMRKICPKLVERFGA